MTSGINTFIPQRTTSKKKPLWMNERAITKVKKKSEAYKRYIETREGQDYMTYCKARNQARRATRQALKAFEKEVARCAKTNPKKFYKYINSRTKVRVGISELHTADRRTISDEEKATALNDFFVSVFTNEDTNPPTCDMHPVDTPCPDLKLTHEQVHDELRSLNESKSPGPDRLHPQVLRETADTIIAPLLTIYQHSLDIGEVPEAWKRARVTAIYKKGSRNDPGNYRPVSITSIC